MKKPFALIITVFLMLFAASCSQFSSQEKGAPTPRILADTVFSGYAFVDENENGELDESDTPLPGARFTLAGFGGVTDANGYAMVLIPGEWDQPVSAQMAPPDDSSYTLIGPGEETLQNGVKNRADFLFAPPPTSSSPQPGSLATTKPMTIDLTYCTTEEGIKLTMDLYRPKQDSGLLPVVLYVHGGGWTSGDKSDGVGLLFKEELTRRGYLFASINYRLGPKYIFPAQIEDVKCAVRYLRAHAAKYRLNPERIGAIGGSAGGHLVALLGTSDAETGWDVGEFADQSSRVQAVVDLFGPADLHAMFAEADRMYMMRIFDASSSDDPTLAEYSPVTYASPDDPPFLIMHGDQDEVVPLEQSQILYERLKAAGVPAELVVVENAAHSFRPVKANIKPSFRQLFQMVGDFFDEHLK